MYIRLDKLQNIARARREPRNIEGRTIPIVRR